MEGVTDERDNTAWVARTLGTFSVRGGWRAAGSTTGAGPTACGAGAAGGAHLEAPGEREADAVCLLDHRTVVSGGAQRASGSGGGAAAQDAQGRRSAKIDGSRAAASAAGPISSASELERAVALRQSGDAGREQPRVAAGAVLLERAPVPEGARPDAAPAARCTQDRGRRACRGALGGARGAQLRSRIRRRSVALGLPSRLAQGGDRARRVGEAAAVGSAGRPLAPCLPRTVVSGRNRREHGSRCDAGVRQAWPAARRHE